MTVRVIPKTSEPKNTKNKISWESIKRFSKNEKHTPKWFPKYPKMALNRDENDIKNGIETIIVSSVSIDASLDMPSLRIY